MSDCFVWNIWRSWSLPMVQYSSEGFGLYQNIFWKCSSHHSCLCFYQERTAEVVATMSILPSAKWCYFFEGIFTLYQTGPCSSVHYVMCHWRAHQVFKLHYLLAQLFLFAYMRRRHINLETTLSMSHSNPPVVIQTSLGPLPIHILLMTAWIHGIISFGLYLFFLYHKVI